MRENVSPWHKHKKAPGQWPGAFSRFYRLDILTMPAIVQGTRTTGLHLAVNHAQSVSDTYAITRKVHQTANMGMTADSNTPRLLFGMISPRIWSPSTVRPLTHKGRIPALYCPGRPALRHGGRVHSQPPVIASSLGACTGTVLVCSGTFTGGAGASAVGVSSSA